MLALFIWSCENRFVLVEESPQSVILIRFTLRVGRSFDRAWLLYILLGYGELDPRRNTSTTDSGHAT